MQRAPLAAASDTESQRGRHHSVELQRWADQRVCEMVPLEVALAGLRLVWAVCAAAAAHHDPAVTAQTLTTGGVGAGIGSRRRSARQSAGAPPPPRTARPPRRAPVPAPTRRAAPATLPPAPEVSPPPDVQGAWSGWPTGPVRPGSRASAVGTGSRRRGCAGSSSRPFFVWRGRCVVATFRPRGRADQGNRSRVSGAITRRRPLPYKDQGPWAGRVSGGEGGNRGGRGPAGME